MFYANGFGQVSLNRFTSFWWLFPLLYGFFLLKLIAGTIQNKTISALTIYGMATFTYFGGRSHGINLYIVSIPFVLLSIYLIFNLKSISSFTKQIFLAAVPAIFVSAHDFYNKPLLIGEVIYKTNLPLIRNFLLFNPERPVIWLTRRLPGSRFSAEPNCSTYSSLKKYLENGSIAILSTHDNNLIPFFACTKSHNALIINPYWETAINPIAVARKIELTKTLKNNYIFVDAELFKEESDPVSPQWYTKMVSSILNQLPLKRIGSINSQGDTLIIYQKRKDLS
jgi:hypothetical protein